MRIVKWNPQERVDIPDMVATDFLVLGDFRRHNREVLLGAEENRILRGFAAEASAIPDAIVTVKLDDAGVYSTALGGENMGAHITYGTLIGGKDDNENVEGNAQATIDFTGQPAATYTLQMRFVYTGGVSDNRAFWNPTTDTEFIQNTETRHVPGVELRISGGASGEWIDIASIVWGGATITSGNITDLRSFAMEGTTPFQQTTQLGSGGVPDFSRSSDRADTAVSLNSVFPVLRALGRQIQDLKGPDDSGNWNWWNYPFRAFDPDGVRTAGTTKSLRTVDTVTYTVGDGTTTFGDFNGVTGVEDCLTHFISQATANRANHISIKLKTNRNDDFQWTVTSLHNLNGAGNRTTLELEGVGSGDTAMSNENKARVNFNPTVNSSYVLAASNIRLKNVHLQLGGVGVDNIFLNAFSLQADNCTLVGDKTVGTAGYLMELAGSYNNRFRNCTIQDGRISVAGSGTVDGGDFRTTFENCHLDEIQLHLDDTYAALSMRDCFFHGREAPFTGSQASIRLRGARDCRFENCRFIYNPGEDCIRAEDGTGIGSSSGNIHVVDCRFEHFGASPHLATLGTNGATGTGWGVYAESGSYANIRGNSFQGEFFADAGAIFANGFAACSISENVGVSLGHASGGSVTFIEVQGTDAFTPTHTTISNNRTVLWAALGSTVDIRGLVLRDCNGVSVTGNNLVGWSGGTINDVTAGGMIVEDCSQCTFTGNTFQQWNDTIAATPRCVRITNSCSFLTFSGNTFNRNGNYSVICDAGNSGIGMVFSGNIVQASSVNNLGFDISTGTCGDCNFTGNIFGFSGAARIGIAIGNNSGFILVGNTGANAIIDRTGTPTGVGYNETQDVNYVNSYT